jgi:outer membrane protein assembly factor BamA
VDPDELSFLRKRSSINEKFFTKIPFTPQELSRTLIKVFNTYLNNGYPFVHLQLDQLKFDEGNLNAHLNVKRGPYYRWSKLHVKGDSSISVKYISNLLNIKVGDFYNESEISKISNRVKQIAFLREIKPSEVLFKKDGAELFLYIESVPVSAVNGIIGFQPNSTTNKLQFTGDINLKLLDVLNRGELLDVRWQSVREQTQSLNSHVNYPFLFNTPFGIDATFDLYKRDTSFLELAATAGVQYFLHRGSYLKGFYQFNSSSVLSGGENNPTFSSLGDVTAHSYGLSYSMQLLDYIPNPTKGINITTEGSIGTRKAIVIDTLPPEKSLVYRGKIKIESFIPLHKRHTIRIAAVSEFYGADEIFENEMYRFGGLNSQRGFNEDELFATTMLTGTVEYRFLIDRNSHVFAFFDQSWYEKNYTNYINDTPFGFGVGFSFSTNLGVFSISYALGKQFDNPILLSNSKVHFGYVFYF